MTTTTTDRVLSAEDIATFWEKGYLRVPGVYTPEETAELRSQLDRLIGEWASTVEWTGPWRQAYMDEKTERDGKFEGMHDLQNYSSAWARGIINPRLVQVLIDVLGPDVEFHHTTMHVKVPSTGMPFPMHQDHPFYPHEDGRYVDVLVHLDDTNPGNGELRFLEGSHLEGPLPHITETADGPCSPHLPVDQYPFSDTVAVPASAGDVVLMTINTVHGSDINRSPDPRRLVRMGYRHPHNQQTGGQSFGRPGVIVAGNRDRREGDEPFATE